MPELNGIPYEELDSPELDFGPTRRLRCRQEDAMELANALAGRVYKPGRNVIQSARPAEHPDYPDFFVREITSRSTVTRDGDKDHVLTVAYSHPCIIPGFRS